MKAGLLLLITAVILNSCHTPPSMMQPPVKRQLDTTVVLHPLFDTLEAPLGRYLKIPGDSVFLKRRAHLYTKGGRLQGDDVLMTTIFLKPYKTYEHAEKIFNIRNTAIEELKNMRAGTYSGEMTLETMEQILADGIYAKTLQITLYDSLRRPVPGIILVNSEDVDQDITEALLSGGSYTYKMNFRSNALSEAVMDSIIVARPVFYNISLIKEAPLQALFTSN